MPTQAAFILAVNGLCVEGACTQPGPEPLAASGAKLGPWGQTLQRTAGGMWWQSSPTGPQRDVVPASPGLVSARGLAAPGGRPWEAEAEAEAGAGSRAWGEVGQLLASARPPPSAGTTCLLTLVAGHTVNEPSLLRPPPGGQGQHPLVRAVPRRAGPQELSQPQGPSPLGF